MAILNVVDEYENQIIDDLGNFVIKATAEREICGSRESVSNRVSISDREVYQNRETV